MKPPRSSLITKRVHLLRAGILLLCAATPATFGQTWSTGNFNTNNGYVRGSSLLDMPTNVPSIEQWKSNDPFVGGYGDTSLIGWNLRYTLGTSVSGANSVFQGGLDAAGGVLPGVTNPSLYKTFDPLTGPVSVFVDFAINPSWNVDQSFLNNDTFAFDLRNEANTASLARFQFVPTLSANTNFTTMQWVKDGVAQTVAQIAFLDIIQMQVTASGTDFNVEISQYSLTNRALQKTNFFAVTSGQFSGGLSASNFGTMSIDWELESGNIDQPGSNFISVNEITVVPEPSPTLLLTLGSVVALVAILRRRTRQL